MDLSEREVCEVLIALNGWKNRLKNKRYATTANLERAKRVEGIIEKVKASIRTISVR